MSLKILLADDHQVMVQGLKALLGCQPDLKVVAEAGTGRTAVSLAEEYAPDVVLMDITMPDLNGIEATRQVTAASPHTRVIALSAHTDHRNASEMLKAGARGYLVKEGVFEELLQAIHTVVAGNVYLSPQVAARIEQDALHLRNGKTSGKSNGPSAFTRLSPREREVLQLMAEGRATKEIAMDLQVSVKTVETHRRQIMEKLNLFSVAELTKYAIGEGITSVELSNHLAVSLTRA
jgi:DNA-binding NarL/FixJ family response regulator